MTHGASKEKRHELVKIDDFLQFFPLSDYYHTMETDIVDKNILFYQKEEKLSKLRNVTVNLREEHLLFVFHVLCK